MVDAIVQRQRKSIIELGASEDNCKVGVALRLPSVQNVAFEMDATAKQDLENLAFLNKVLRRMEIKGYCDTMYLRGMQVYKADRVIISDVEGFEILLFDLKANPHLSHTPHLLEFHDFILARTSETLLRRIQHTKASSYSGRRKIRDIDLNFRGELLDQPLAQVVSRRGGQRDESSSHSMAVDGS